MVSDPTRFDSLVSAALSETGAQPGRALVPLPQQPPPMTEFDKFSGLDASFLAHLIATRDRAPQTLKLRRTTAGEASETYEHAAPHQDDVISLKES